MAWADICVRLRRNAQDLNNHVANEAKSHLPLGVQPGGLMPKPILPKLLKLKEGSLSLRRIPSSHIPGRFDGEPDGDGSGEVVPCSMA